MTEMLGLTKDVSRAWILATGVAIAALLAGSQVAAQEKATELQPLVIQGGGSQQKGEESGTELHACGNVGNSTVVIVLWAGLRAWREPDVCRSGATLIEQDEQPWILGNIVPTGLRRAIDVPYIGDDAVPLTAVNAANDGETADLVLHSGLKRHLQLPVLLRVIILQIKLKLL